MTLVRMALLALACLLLFNWPLPAAKPIPIGTRLELFADDLLIEELNGNVSRHLLHPEPKEVVLVTDEAWEGNTCAYYTIFQDGDLYRMYYRGSHYKEQAGKPGHAEVTCYAESKDGVHWKKPKLGLFEFNGSKENNIVWDGIGTHNFVAFKDANPDCLAHARYKGMARGKPRGKHGLYIYQSADAIHWNLMQPEPVITEGKFDSQNLAFWDSHAQLYREYHRTSVNGKRAIMTGTSGDYVNWTKPVLLEYPGVPAEHLYTNAVMPYPRAPHLLIGFPTRYLPQEGHRVEPTFMASRDGVTFRRWPEPLIPETAPVDRGGNRSNYMAWGLVELPNRPNHYSVYATEAYYTGPDSRLRRFEFRKDGFISIRADEEGGELLTKPLVLDALAERLVLNFKTLRGGLIRVGLESTDGKPLAGYEIENCSPLSGDHIEHNVSWNNGADLSVLEGKTVRLRFQLKQADLYSLRFQPWLR